ncbi:substrate-binding domain-containing protein [Microbacterium trichothecenolyticum]|uniref:substrate-binding domain-containing protein n=1 Tax=Microbacterium trichothecenolyticum TaxID=69370 RepID=UPI0037C8FF8F
MVDVHTEDPSRFPLSVGTAKVERLSVDPRVLVATVARHVVHHPALARSRHAPRCARIPQPDELALGFMSAMESAGRRAPADYSIVGVDDMPTAAYFSPPLTSTRLDFRAPRRCTCCRSRFARALSQSATWKTRSLLSGSRPRRSGEDQQSNDRGSARALSLRATADSAAPDGGVSAGDGDIDDPVVPSVCDGRDLLDGAVVPVHPRPYRYARLCPPHPLRTARFRRHVDGAAATVGPPFVSPLRKPIRVPLVRSHPPGLPFPGRWHQATPGPLT